MFKMVKLRYGSDNLPEELLIQESDATNFSSQDKLLAPQPIKTRLQGPLPSPSHSVST